jgi:hypothetical protein
LPEYDPDRTKRRAPVLAFDVIDGKAYRQRKMAD